MRSELKFNMNKNGKFVCFLLTALILLSMIGCKSKPEDIPHEKDTNEPSSSLSTNGAVAVTDKNNEYALCIGNQFFQISKDLVLKSILENGKAEEVPEDSPFPAGRRYSADGLKIATFMVDDERGKGEIIYHILAQKDAKTPRGVGIGDTLAALKTAYPDLVYENGFYSYDGEIKYNRCYSYVPNDGTANYIRFYLYEKKIVMIEAGDGLDMRPGSWLPYDNIFGMPNICKEINDVTPKGMNTRYFYINDAGEEKVLLDINARSVEEKDIDEDGMTELVVYLAGSTQSIGIYDFVHEEITYMNINEKLQCHSSEYMGNMGNLKGEYRNCIEARFLNKDGTLRSEVYRFSNNELTYVSPFSNDLLM